MKSVSSERTGSSTSACAASGDPRAVTAIRRAPYSRAMSQLASISACCRWPRTPAPRRRASSVAATIFWRTASWIRGHGVPEPRQPVARLVGHEGRAATHAESVDHAGVQQQPRGNADAFRVDQLAIDLQRVDDIGMNALRQRRRRARLRQRHRLQEARAHGGGLGQPQLQVAHIAAADGLGEARDTRLSLTAALRASSLMPWPPPRRPGLPGSPGPPSARPDAARGRARQCGADVRKARSWRVVGAPPGRGAGDACYFITRMKYRSFKAMITSIRIFAGAMTVCVRQSIKVNTAGIIDPLNKALGRMDSPLAPRKRRPGRLVSVVRKTSACPPLCSMRERLAHNLTWMRRFMGEYGVQLAPHGNTTTLAAGAVRAAVAGRCLGHHPGHRASDTARRAPRMV